MSIRNDNMDAYKVIGLKVYELRRANNMSRKMLADKLEITQQQLHKYETGANRISAGRLAQLANILEVSIDVFYEKIYDKPSIESVSRNSAYFSLSKNLMKLTNPVHQSLVKDLVNTLAKEEQKPKIA